MNQKCKEFEDKDEGPLWEKAQEPEE